MIGSLGNAAKPQLAEPLAMNSSNPAAMVALIRTTLPSNSAGFARMSHTEVAG